MEYKFSMEYKILSKPIIYDKEWRCIKQSY